MAMTTLSCYTSNLQVSPYMQMYNLNVPLFMYNHVDVQPACTTQIIGGSSNVGKVDEIDGYTGNEA